VLCKLGRIKSVIRHGQNVGIVLFRPDYILSEVYRPRNHQSVVVVNAHSVSVSEVSDSPKVLELWRIGEEAHALQPTIAESFIDGDRNLISEEFVEDWSQ